jgi:hypothetical protein
MLQSYKTRFSTRINFGSYVSVLYTDYLSMINNRKSKPILFADGSSVTFTSCNLETFKFGINAVLEYLRKPLKASRQNATLVQAWTDP